MADHWGDWAAEFADNAVPVLKPVTYAYKYRHDIQKYWKKLLVAMKAGRPDVLVTGTSGAGKSVLMSNYHGEANELSWREPGASANTEIKPIGIGEWFKIVHVLPGQHGFEKSVALDKGFGSASDLSGVIHVVDWGYTLIRDSVIREQLIKEQGIATIEALRQKSLQIELEEFRQICNQIQQSIAAKRGPRWLIVAVNKVDLYLDRLNEAQAYYHQSSKSEFANILKSLLLQVGQNNLKIKVLPVCSMPGPFEWNGETVRPQTDSVEHHRNFMRKFIDEIGQVAR